MIRLLAPILLVAAAVCGGCARTEAVRTAPPAVAGSLRTARNEFALAGLREVPVVYEVANRGNRAARLEFPTDQRVEITLRGPDGRPLFLWSEDRLFAPRPSLVTVNPGERLEYTAGLPTRDMAPGGDYTVEAMLPGHPATTATLVLRPR